MNVSQWIMLGAIIVYLIVMLIIGAVCSRKNKNVTDFYLGGRKLSPLVTAMSAEASDMSSWLLMGLPGVALFTGVAEAFWTAVGLAIGTYLNWLFVSKRLRRYSAHINATTVPEFFSRRFGDDKNILNAIAAVVIIIFFVPYTASGFAACGKLFSTLFGAPYLFAMIVCAVVIVLYCTMGGFLAASTTDLVQSIVMTIALFVIIGFGEGMVHGFDHVFENVRNLDGYMNVFKGFNIGTGKTGSYGFLPVVSTLAWGLGYFGMPHILLRFMAIEDEKKLKTSRRIASVWVVISMAVAILIGVVGYSLIKGGFIAPFADSSAAETVVVSISKFLSGFGYIPAAVAGVILAGILAATMSTSDSQLLAAASSVSQNLLREFFKVKISDKLAMWIARLSVIAISAVAVVLALDANSSVFRIVSFAWAGFGAAFGPLVLTALFWKRCNKWGALAGMLTGGAMVFIWKYLVRPLGGAWDIYELLPAFVLSLLAIIVVSLLTKAPGKDVTDTFEAVRTGKTNA